LLEDLATTLRHQPDLRRLHRVILAIGVGLVVVTVAVAVFTIWQSRLAALRDAEADSIAIGRILSEQTQRTVQVYDLLLRNIRSRHAPADPQPAESLYAQWESLGTHTALKESIASLPRSSAIGLVDANGIVRNTSRAWPSAGLDLSDRDNHRSLKATPIDSLHIMLNIEARATGEPVIYLSRRITGPDGGYLGFVAGGIDVPELSGFYQTLSVHPGRMITLLHRDGTILATYPRRDDRIGKVVPSRSSWHQAVANARDVQLYHGPHFMTDAPAIASVHLVAGVPLVLDISRDQGDVLAEWRQQIVGVVGGQALVIAATILFLGLITRQFRAQDRQLEILKDVGETAIGNAKRLNDYAGMASDWFWEQDSDLRFVPIETRVPSTRSAQDQSSFGRTRRHLVGVDPDDPAWDAHEADLAARRPFRDFRYQRIGHDGLVHHLSVSGRPIFDAEGRFSGYRGVGRDITADVEAAEALRIAKEHAEAGMLARTQFLANMSHELRTPLNVIIGFSDLIEAQARARGQGQPIAEYAGEIQTSGRELLAMVNAILDLSRLEDGTYQLREDVVRPDFTIQSCLSELWPVADEKGVRIDYQRPDFTVAMRCDGHAVRQVLLNVLGNAVKFTEPGGSVSVRLERRENGALVIRVADTGIGIAPTEQQRLFEAFYQANASSTRVHGGSGIGLAIAHRLMTLHAGAIELDSTPGEGTVIRLVFPEARVMETTSSVG